MLTDLTILLKNKLDSSQGELKGQIASLLKAEKEILNNFFDEIDVHSLDNLVQILKAATGMIFISGVGKSGHVAEKIAATLASIGIKSFFVSPINALHGDIGIASEGDIFILLSKSGESDELLHLIPFLRNKKVKIISLVNKASSRLEKASDLTIMLPLARELCPFDLVPTTSTITQMIFGDILTVALMIQKEFSLEEYALNHPLGKIGRRLTFKVRNLMLTGNNIPLCNPKDKLVDTLVKLSNKKCGCVLIVDSDKKMLGIFTDGDLRRSIQKLESRALEYDMEQLMTVNPRSIGPEEMATKALEVMEHDQKHPVTVLPVLDKGVVVGIIKLHDILQAGL